MKKILLTLLLCLTLFSSCKSPKQEEVPQQQTIDYSEFFIAEQKKTDYIIFSDFIMSYRIINNSDLSKIINSTIRHSKEPKIMLSIFSVESKFNKNAVSYLGKDYGIGVGQVSLIGLTDYNWKHNTNYTQEDLYDIETNIMISCWIFEYNEKYGISGLNKKIIAYNEGHVYAKNKENSKYLDKVIERAYSIGYEGEKNGRKSS